MSKFRRPGFYVEERFFDNKEAQAKAFAAHRASIFGRCVKVTHVRTSASKHAEWVADFWPKKVAA